MRSRARTGLKSKRKIGISFQAWRRAARGNRLVTILEFGMILRDVAGSSSGAAGLCISSNKSAKCQGNFFTVFHMQRGKEEGEKKPHAALRQGRRQTGPPSSDVRAKAPRLGTSSCALLWVAHCGSRSLGLKQQTLVHLRPPPLLRSPAAGRARGVGLRRWACATVACCPAGWLRLQAASGPVPGPQWAVPPCGTAAGPRCNPGASWPGVARLFWRFNFNMAEVSRDSEAAERGPEGSSPEAVPGDATIPRVKLLDAIVDTFLQKLVADRSYERFTTCYKHFHQLNPEVTQRIYDKFVAQLQTSIREEISEIKEEGNLEAVLNSLDKIIEEGRERGEPAWRPSGIPEKDLCSVMAPYFLKQQDTLCHQVRKQEAKNQELADAVLAGRRQVEELQQQVRALQQTWQALHREQRELLSVLRAPE